MEKRREYVKRERAGDKHVIVTEEEIFNADRKRFPTHREYVEHRFFQEHRLYVLSHLALEYRISKCGKAIAVWGKVGSSLVYRNPKDET